MPFDTKPVQLLALCGSLRHSSYCMSILQTLRETLGSATELEIFPIGEVPPYDEDHDNAESPLPVVALKQAITAADGLVIISPEYNHGIPGVLKNVLDWASRPAMRSPMRGKPVLMMTASPAFTGGVRAQAQLRETLMSMLARVVARPEIVFASVHEKIKDERLVDEASLHFALAGIDDLVGEIRASARRD
jgi:chromate reductase